MGVGRAQAQSLNTYHIGNSLTWDARIGDGLPTLAGDAGLQLNTGFHINCNQSLSTIAANPDEVCVSPNSFGTYTQAFADNAWDAITLQPFSGSTPQQEYLAFKSLVQQARLNPDNLDTRFYLYASWPGTPHAGATFYSEWYDPAPVDPNTDLVRNANGFNWIFERLKADPDLQGVDLSIIPVGDVLAEIDFRMRSDLIPGFTDGRQLYRDAVHMNNLGQFIAANTVIATMFGQDTTGTPTNSGFEAGPFQGIPIEITPDLATAVQKAVWYVTSSYPQKGTTWGDLNRDGFVGIDDLNTVLLNWNQSVTPVEYLPSDLNQDGFVGINDLNTVLLNWNQSVTPGDVLAGDINGDGFVGVNDMNLILQDWNQSVPHGDPLAGDANGNGFVGVDDLNTVLGRWNTGTLPPEAGAIIPEPGTLILFAGVLSVLTARRR